MTPEELAVIAADRRKIDEVIGALIKDREHVAAMLAEDRRELITALNRRDVQIARLALLVDRLLKDRRGEPYVDPRMDPDWKE